MIRLRLIDSSALVLALVAGPFVPTLGAQRAFRAGIGMSRLTSRDGGPNSTGWTGSLGFLANSTSETDLLVTKWSDTGFGTGANSVTGFGVDDRYFPVELSGVAPFITTGINFFKYTTPAGFLTPASSQWAFGSAMGLGLGASLGDHFWVGVEGRFRVDNDQRSTELRVQSMYGVGALRTPHSRPGTIEPFAISVSRLGHGPYTAQSPYAGVRIRRDETRHGSIAVDMGITTFDHDSGGATGVTTWLVQPAAEFGWGRSWGRPFIEIGPQMLGFVGGIDDGMKIGLHTGGGFDVKLSESMELALLSRVTWFQSIDARHQFGLQLGVAIGPRLMRDRSALPEKGPKVE